MDHDLTEPTGALAIADDSFEWYRKYAQQARHGYYVSETLLLITAALVPVSTVVTHRSWVTAVLGALVVVLTGVRRIYNWQEDWIRFTDACARLKTERQLFAHHIEPYDGPDAEALLIRTVRRIETEETSSWKSTRDSAKPPSTS
jgi:Protein of unknown function (DUF4231)